MFRQFDGKGKPVPTLLSINAQERGDAYKGRAEWRIRKRIFFADMELREGVFSITQFTGPMPLSREQAFYLQECFFGLLNIPLNTRYSDMNEGEREGPKIAIQWLKHHRPNLTEFLESVIMNVSYKKGWTIVKLCVNGIEDRNHYFAFWVNLEVRAIHLVREE